MSNSVLLPLALDRVTSVGQNSDSRKIPAQRAFSKHSKTYQKHTRDEFTGATRVIRFPS